MVNTKIIADLPIELGNRKDIVSFRNSYFFEYQEDGLIIFII